MSQQLSETEFASQEAQIALTQIERVDLADLKLKLPVWIQKSGAAVAALTVIKQVTNDDEDAAAEKLLVKVRKTYDLINGQRLEFTRQIDEIKAACMEPENSIDPKKVNEYSRVKKLRDDHARAKLAAAQKIQEDARKEQARRDELSRLKALFEQRFFDNILSAVKSLDSSLSTWMQGITLEKYDAAVSNLSVKPNLKRELFDSWFAVTYDANAVPTADFNSFMQQVRAQYTYESINVKYQEQAEATVKSFRDKLPGLKTDLERIAALKGQEAQDAAAKLKEEQDAAATQRQSDLNKQADEERARIAESEALSKLNNAFDATVAIQTASTDIKGARKTKVAVVNAAPDQLVTVFAKLLFACAVTPGFPGYIKKDAAGNDKVDDNGIPEYADWLQPLLTFYAKNCESAPIDGIVFKDVISTIQGGRKK